MHKQGWKNNELMNKYISMFYYVYTLKRRHLVLYNKHNIGVNKLEPVIV